jgi:glycosyltransferase involved in cell wall biosynthesis
MNGSGSLTLHTAGRVLRAEGLTALRERISDRVRETLRRRSFRAVEHRLGAAGLPAIPVLNLLPTAPTPRLGGMQAQLLLRIESEAERRPVALLYPEDERYRLEVTAAGRRLALGIEGGPPPTPVALRDAPFERAVARAAAEVGARALHVEGLASIPLGSLAELHRSGLALVLSVHDFSLFCPRPHLLERPQLRFCHYSRDRERCARCLAQDWPVDLRFQDGRREIARQLLLAAAAVVYPSEFLRDRHLELFPGLPRERQRIIEPAVAEPAVAEPAVAAGPGGPPRPAGAVRHVAYIGQVQPHKGALIFEGVVERLPPGSYPDLRFSAFGGGDAELLHRLRRLPSVRVHGYYRSGSLVDRLRRTQVDLALLLSIVPESYSLALSECLAAGVPVIAFDHGAIAERIRRHGGGLLVAPDAGAEGIAPLVAALAEGRQAPPAVPAAVGPAPADAVAAFQALYRELGLS